MTIRYHNTFRDIMSFCSFHYPRSPVVMGSYVISCLLAAYPFFGMVQILPSDVSPAKRVTMFIFMELIAMFVITGIFAVTAVLSMVSRRNKTVLTEHTITLADGSFTEETAYSKTEHKWSGVQKLARTRRHIFIYVAQHMAHVVPRRAFQDDAEWDSFYEFCKQKVPAA